MQTANIDKEQQNKNKDKHSFSRFVPFEKRLKGVAWSLLFITLFLITYLFNLIFINIYPGQAGVLWKRFDNGVEQKVYGGGLHIVNPFNKMYVYETRVQQREANFTVLTSSGLTFKIKASMRFHPVIDQLFVLHEEVGPDYIERVVIPEVRSVIRRVVGSHELEEVYATQGETLNQFIETGLKELKERHIVLNDLLIKEIILPDALVDAIQKKLVEEQKYEAYKFIIKREAKEAMRKKIEAEGIKRFQSIINDGLTPSYLKYQGIQATVALAQSDNAKMVIMGNKDGLPLILNTGDSSNNTKLPHPPLIEAQEVSQAKRLEQVTSSNIQTNSNTNNVETQAQTRVEQILDIEGNLVEEITRNQ